MSAPFMNEHSGALRREGSSVDILQRTATSGLIVRLNPIVCLTPVVELSILCGSTILTITLHKGASSLTNHVAVCSVSVPDRGK